MLRIRLSRRGKKHQKTYRIVVIEKEKAAKGKPVEILGHYDPKSKELHLEQERVKYWIDNGAQPTETVAKIIEKSKGQNDAKLPVRDFKKKTKKEKKAAAEKKEESKEDKPAKEEKKEEALKEDKPKEESKKPAEDKKEEKPADKK